MPSQLTCRLTLSLTAMMLLGPVHAGQQQDYQQWLLQTQREYKEYLDANDRAFLKFLDHRWQQLDTNAAEQRDPNPKPPIAPIAQPKSSPATPEPSPTEPASPEPSITKPSTPPSNELPPLTPPSVVQPQTEKPDPQIADGEAEGKGKAEDDSLSLEFFGQTIKLNGARKLRLAKAPGRRPQAFADSWQTMAQQDWQPLLQQLQQQFTTLKLNRWGQYLLIRQTADAIQPDHDRRLLSAWFLLIKAGIDSRIAYNSQSLWLLSASEQPVYNVTYLTVNGERYYELGNPLASQSQPPLDANTRVSTYKQQHQSGNLGLDFRHPYQFLATGETVQRQLGFDWHGHQQQFSFSYPANLIPWLASYPQLPLKDYFEAGLPEAAAQQWSAELKPRLQGMTDTEAVNYLLRLVQTGFAYQTDEQQFQTENYLYPLETLYYPYSDCEDRAALFSWLVRELLQLPVAMVEFPGHVATAIALDNAEGYGWYWQGRRYVIADPTYINADLGMIMPNLRQHNPTLSQL